MNKVFNKKRKAAFGAIMPLVDLGLQITGAASGAIQAGIEYDENGVPINEKDFKNRKLVSSLVDPITGLKTIMTGGYNKELRELKEQGAEKEKLEFEAKRNKDFVTLQTNDNNEKMFTYAAGGKGKVTVDNGTLKPIAEDTVVAEGDTHEEGGMDLKANGKQLMEIEDKEVINDNKIYSDRILINDQATVAEEAKRIGTEKGKYEKMLKSAPTYLKSKYQNIITSLDSKLKNLFGKQEQIKKDAGIDNNTEMAANGGLIDNNTQPFHPWKNTDDYFSYLEYKKTHPDINEEDYIKVKNVELQGTQSGGIDYNDLSFSKFRPSDNTTKLEPLPATDLFNSLKEDTNKFKPLDNYQVRDETKDFYTEPNTKLNETLKGIKNNKSSNLKNLDIQGIGEIANVVGDNVFAAIKNEQLKKIKVPEPELEEPTPLKTTQNISASLSEIDKGVTATNKLLRDNSASSNQMMAKASNVQANSDIAKADLYQNKENVETQLKNQNIIMANTVDARNKMKLDKFNTSKYNKQVLTEIVNPTENVRDLTGDLAHLQEVNDMKNYQDQQLALLALRTDDTDSMIRILGALPDEQINDSKFINTVKQSLQGKSDTVKTEYLRKINAARKQANLKPITID